MSESYYFWIILYLCPVFWKILGWHEPLMQTARQSMVTPITAIFSIWKYKCLVPGVSVWCKMISSHMYCIVVLLVQLMSRNYSEEEWSLSCQQFALDESITCIKPRLGSHWRSFSWLCFSVSIINKPRL